jgi:hypothetical protein
MWEMRKAKNLRIDEAGMRIFNHVTGTFRAWTRGTEEALAICKKI